MHLEYGHYLQRLAHRLLVEELGYPLGARLLEVDDCPPGTEGEIASPIAYQAAAWCRRKGIGVERSMDNPEVIAGEILSENAKIPPDLQWFSLCRGGAGFINARPNDIFYRSFAESLLCSGTELFYSPASIRAGGVPSDELALKLKTDWAKVAARFPALDEEARQFLAERGPAGAWNCDDRLMVLGALGCGELSLRPYLQGISGRQNLPWYFDRYHRCSEEFCGMYDQPAHPQDFADVSRGDLNCGSAAGYAFTAFRHLLRFRSIVFCEPEERRPLKLINWCVEGAQNFFAFYNFPGSRSAQLGNSYSAAAAVSAWNSKLIQRCVRALSA